MGALKDLPDSWVWEQLGNCGKWSSGGTPSAKVINYYGGPIPWLNSGELDDGIVYTAQKSLSQEGYDNSSAKLLPPQTLLVAMYGATIGKAAITGFECSTNQAVAACQPNENFDVRFLLYYVISQREMLRKLGQGGAQPNISQALLKAYPCPRPPITDQKSIVARIDALFAQIDEGEAALSDARAGVETYRKSLLKAAVTGELTADWRSTNPPQESGADLLQRILTKRRARWGKTSLNARRSEKVSSDVAERDLPALPEGWLWCRNDQAGTVQLGRQRTPKDHHGPHMRPYLRVANVYEDRLALTDVKQMNFSPSEFETFRLNDGDILLNEGQSLELVGRPAMYRGEIDGCCFQNTLVRFRVTDEVDKDFALLTFLYAMHAGRFQRIAKITTNIAHLGAGRFAELGFPLAPLREQQEAVRLYRVHMRRFEEAISTLTATNALRQSILAAAFRGELIA